MQKRTFIKSLAAVTALSAIVLLTGCDEEKAVAEKPFRVGVTAGPHAAIVTEAAKVAAKNGLKVEVIEFTDYVTPDTALNDGALDAAVYQHEPFLLNFNKQKGTKLANVGNAVVQPMGFYSNKVKSIADIPEGAVISVPNDPTNCGRGLLLLQAAGLIKLPEGMGSEVRAHHHRRASGPQERQERSGLRQVLPLARSQGLRRKDLQRHDQAELVITAFCA